MEAAHVMLDLLVLIVKCHTVDQRVMHRAYFALYCADLSLVTYNIQKMGVM